MKRSTHDDARQVQLGLTLVEILVAVAVLGVILAVATPSLAALMERRRVIAVAGELASLFNYAKSETNAIGNELVLHLEPMSDMDASCARISNASNFDNCGCDKPAAEVCNTPASQKLREFILPRDTGVSFVASGTWSVDKNQVYFSRNRHYTDIANVHVTVTGRRTGTQLRIEYNNVGRVRICSPADVVGGFQAC